MKKYIDIIKLIILSIIIGIVVGVLDVIFGDGLKIIGDLRNSYFIYLIWFLPIIGLLITYLYKKYGKNTKQGMSLVFDVAFEEEEKVPLRLIPLLTISTWLTHLFGGSAGREGVAVQLGAAIGNNVGKRSHIKDAHKLLLVAGMAAGFAGLFQTPIAAIFFALEVLVVGRLYYEAIVVASFASFSAYFTSHALHLEQFKFPISFTHGLDPIFILKLFALAICFGLCGRLFSQALSYAKNKFTKLFPNEYKRIAIVGAAVAILMFLCLQGRYAGLGTNLIEASFHHEAVLPYDFILKLILTILTISIGFQGGEVTPLFAIGSTLGVLLASLLGLPIVFCAALGYAAVFSSATNTLLGPIFIGCEVFGYTMLPYMFIVCLIAYLVNGNTSIYGKQRKSQNIAK